MGLQMMFGCLFISMTLPVSVFFFSVAHSAKLIILMFGAAFVWLVSSLLASIIWIAVVPLKVLNVYSYFYLCQQSLQHDS